MNIAGAFAISLGGEQKILPDRLQARLQEAVAGLQDLFGADQFDELANYVLKEGDTLVERLSPPFFANLVAPVTLATMRETGTAGLPRFAPEELELFLDGVADGDEKPIGCWLELARIDDATTWVAYPQDSRASARFVVYLPVIVGPEETRLVAVDLGMDLTTDATEPPSVLAGSGCELGWRGHGPDLRQACLPGTCAGPCGERWKLTRGERVLVACVC